MVILSLRIRDLWSGKNLDHLHADGTWLNWVDGSHSWLPLARLRPLQYRAGQ